MAVSSRACGRTKRHEGGSDLLIPAIVVFIYLAVVLYIGIFAFRKAASKRQAEDYFLASRSLGPFVFLFSLFGTNMTAFAILGSSGHAFANRSEERRVGKECRSRW